MVLTFIVCQNELYVNSCVYITHGKVSEMGLAIWRRKKLIQQQQACVFKKSKCSCFVIARSPCLNIVGDI